MVLSKSRATVLSHGQVPAVRGARFRHVALVAFLVALPAPTSAQVLNFRHYTGTEGLPQAQILALHQDARHYLWVGTYGGLSRFNGGEFRTYDTSDGLASNAITTIAEDVDGRIHVGSTGGGVCTIDGAAVHCLREKDGLPHDFVFDIMVDADGRSLWVATQRGVARVASGKVQALTPQDSVASGMVFRIIRDRAGAVWLGGENGLSRSDGTRFERAFHSSLGDAPVHMMLDTQWGLLFASGSRLFLARGDTLTTLSLPGIPPRTLVTDADVDPKGGVWIATRAGVFHYDGSRFERYTTRNGLLFDQANRVRVDREGNVWVGTERGLSRLTPGPFRHYTASEGLPNSFVRAIAADASGRLWLGTRDGIAVREGDSLRVVDLGGELTDRRIFALAPLPNGGMLIGTRAGLAHHDGTRVRHVYRVADGLPGDVVPSLLPDGNGGVWIGTDAGLAHWRDGRVTHIKGHDALNDHFIITMAVDGKGRLWLGGRANGVIIHDGKSTTQLGAARGLTDQSIWSIARADDGGMWLGSNGDGVYRVASDDITDIRRLTKTNGLIDDFIWQVQPDAQGGLWLYTNRGLDRVMPDSTIQHYGRGRGLLELEGAANATWRDENGELWFGTALGLVRYTPALDVPAATRPAVYIEDILSGADTVSRNGARVRAGGGVLKIRFASPTFRDETGVRYRYRLLGTGADWSEQTAERSIGYAGLAPGDYEFQVFAIDADGGTSAPDSFAFVVSPLYWQTWWFRIGGVVLVLAIGGAIGVVRNRSLRAEQRRLEAIVADRTHELSAKNSALEREVADRQRAEDALRQSQQRLLEVVEYSTNMFYSHDANGVITYVSPQSRQILGCEPEEALRRYHEFVTDHAVNAAGETASQRAIETGEQQPPYQLQLKGMDGVIRWVEVNEAPVTRDGRTIRIVGSLTDITAAKQAAAEQERLQSQLRQAQKMEAVGRLAGGIAHDFNNLLTAVVGNTELVAAALDSDHPLHAELAQVRQAADRAASLVSQLLAFSRQQLIRRRVFDLNTVVTDSARMLRRMIGADIELVLELAPDPVCIRADQAQLDQVVMNLALNARDAMPAGGRLIIQTEVVELDGQPMPGLEDDIEPGHYVELRVTDTGHGMDADTIRHVFEPFYTTKDVGKGTGLGLATVYGIITQNSGAVRIDSAAGRGTTFHVFLPQVADEAVDTDAAAAAPAPAETQVRAQHGAGVILVVEDEDAVRQLVCRALQRHGYRVFEAHDGTRALHVCEQHGADIDLLLTDMVMPGLNGRQVAEQVSRLHPQVRVLYMSGHTNDVLGSRFMLDDATQVVQKPFAPAELVQRVKEVLA